MKKSAWPLSVLELLKILENLEPIIRVLQPFPPDCKRLKSNFHCIYCTWFSTFLLLFIVSVIIQCHYPLLCTQTCMLLMQGTWCPAVSFMVGSAHLMVGRVLLMLGPVDSQLNAIPRSRDAASYQVVRAWCWAACGWCLSVHAWCRAMHAWCQAADTWCRAARTWCLAPLNFFPPTFCHFSTKHPQIFSNPL